MSRLQGSCLCGAVSYEIHGKVSDIGQCHCPKCRKASGTAHAATLLTAASGFAWLSGAELVKAYATESDYHRSFCSKCGSPVPRDRGKVFAIPAGSLDDDPGVQPVFHAFVSRKAPWHEVTDDVPQHPERPPRRE